MITDAIVTIVLDPFMGSGTTAIAARELGMHYLDPGVAAVARTRVQSGVDTTWVNG